MNRNKEYEALVKDLYKVPPQLEGTLQRARAREERRKKRWKVFGLPAGSLAACFLGFMLLVNLFPPFAKACGGVPLLRELAQAVAWSPSLSAAVENDYVQPIETSQTQNGITATVHYVIVDRKKVTLFYSLDYPKSMGEQMYMDYNYGDLHGWSGNVGGFCDHSGELKEVNLDFVERDVPDTLEFTLSVYAPEPETSAQAPVSDAQADYFTKPEQAVPDYLAEFTFHLEFSPYYTAQGKIVPVNATFSLGEQTMTLKEVELYPTHLRVNLSADPDNTAWLKGMELYLENEHGERFESSINGITATGEPDGEGYGTFWLDSPFFQQGDHLTLYITEAKWLDKDAPEVRLDLAHGTAEHLPEDIRFWKAEKMSGGWLVSFTASMETENRMHSLFDRCFWDEAGNLYDVWQFSSTIGMVDPLTGDRLMEDTMFTEEFPLADFYGDVVYLKPTFHYRTSFPKPVSVFIQ